MTIAYEYKRLTDPTEEALNALGAEGFYIVANYADPKTTFTQVVILQREVEKVPTFEELLNVPGVVLPVITAPKPVEPPSLAEQVYAQYQLEQSNKAAQVPQSAVEYGEQKLNHILLDENGKKVE
jgi:hypothetical protein